MPSSFTCSAESQKDRVKFDILRAVHRDIRVLELQ